MGLISIAGKRGGSPGMALSRAVFGQHGNLFPGSLIPVARWGWETIAVLPRTPAAPPGSEESAAQREPATLSI